MAHKSVPPTPNDSDPRNTDPLTGEAGAHPVGVGVGAALGGAAAGAAAGAVAGPVGAAVAAIAGGVAGGYAGKATAEAIDPTVETAYWRETYPTRPYFRDDYTYEDYAPAYETGWEMEYAEGEGASWDDREDEARRRWEQRADEPAGMTWDEAKVAARDAYERVAERRRLERAANKPR